jgi:hypothetical protein
VGQGRGNFKERHAHHGCTSLVSRSEAFTTSDLLTTVGALLGGSARGDPHCKICVSLNNNPCSLPADSLYRGWLASVLSALKAKIPSPPARKLEPHFIVLYFASRSTTPPKRQLSSSSQIPGSANCDLGLWPLTNNQNFEVPQVHMRALVSERTIDTITPNNATSSSLNRL